MDISRSGDSSAGNGERARLTKLAFAMVAVFLAYNLFSYFAGIYVSRYLSQPNSTFSDRALRVESLMYLVTVGFVFSEMLVVIWAYRPIGNLFRGRSQNAKAISFYDFAVGVGGAVVGSVLAIPFIASLRNVLIITAIIYEHKTSAGQVALLAALVGIALPVAMEIVFRGIAQRTLESAVSAPAAILVSAVLFAELSPGFPFVVSLLLGLISGSLFLWRRNLLTPITVNVAMTIFLGAYLGLKLLH